MKAATLVQQSVRIEGRPLERELARRLAGVLAAESLAEPMLIAWYDGQKGEEHPEVPECQHKPGWLAYAEGHGGRLRVDVNEGEFSFIFADVAAAG